MTIQKIRLLIAAGFLTVMPVLALSPVFTAHAQQEDTSGNTAQTDTSSDSNSNTTSEDQQPVVNQDVQRETVRPQLHKKPKIRKFSFSYLISKLFGVDM